MSSRKRFLLKVLCLNYMMSFSKKYPSAALLLTVSYSVV